MKVPSLLSINPAKMVMILWLPASLPVTFLLSSNRQKPYVSPLLFGNSRRRLSKNLSYWPPVLNAILTFFMSMKTFVKSSILSLISLSSFASCLSTRSPRYFIRGRVRVLGSSSLRYGSPALLKTRQSWWVKNSVRVWVFNNLVLASFFSTRNELCKLNQVLFLSNTTTIHNSILFTFRPWNTHKNKVLGHPQQADSILYMFFSWNLQEKTPML